MDESIWRREPNMLRENITLWQDGDKVISRVWNLQKAEV